MKLKRYLTIELLEEYERVNFYSILYKGEKLTEFEKFLMAYKDSYSQDVGTIMYRMERITQDGVFDRHFRYAGRVKDRTAELPSHFDTSNLRLYCLCISPQILILGNGGLKGTRTYNEDPHLNSCVEALQKIDFVINKKEGYGSISINGKTLVGNLSLYITEDQEQ